MSDQQTRDVFERLQFCPIGGEKLEDHPLGDAKSCYVHGDFSKQWDSRNPTELIIVFRGMCMRSE